MDSNRHPPPPRQAAQATASGLTCAVGGVGVIDALDASTYGPLTPSEVTEIVTRLRSHDDPGPTAPDVPWAAVVRRADSSVVATCSMMLPSGLFWTLRNGAFGGGYTLIVATDVASVVEHLGGGAALNRDYLRSFARGQVPTRGTAFAQIHRLLPGESLVWRPDTPAEMSQTTWLGPESFGEPWLRGRDAIEEFTRVLDEIVADLVGRTDTLVTALSGGLDSTFVAASLLRGTPTERPIHAFCHRPLGHPDNSAFPGWDPDDWPWAQLFSRVSADRIRLGALTNTTAVHPLDAAATFSDRCAIPAYGPANQVWMNALTDAAWQASAGLQFSGLFGNLAFSHPHDYAARYYLHRRQWGDLVGLATDAKNSGAGAGLPGRVRRQLLHPLRHGGAVPSREGWLEHLTHRAIGNAVQLNPAGLRDVLHADPFTSRALMEVAAAITPREWRRTPESALFLSRGFARRAGAGRVPDAVRLRTTRGGQAWDAPDQWRANPRRADRALEILAGQTWLADGATVDWTADVLRGLWSSPVGSGYGGDLNAVARLLGVAEFAERWAA